VWASDRARHAYQQPSEVAALLVFHRTLFRSSIRIRPRVDS